MLVTGKILLVALLVVYSVVSFAAKNDWAEGNEGLADGASREFYNRAGMLPWNNFMGDWRDVENIEQGEKPYAVETVVDDDTPVFAEWNVTALVQEWVNGKYQNQGMFLRAIEGGVIHFNSREHPNENQHPQLVIKYDDGEIKLSAIADTYIDSSTYRSLGYEETLIVAGDSSNTLLRFDLGDINKSSKILNATLRLFTFEQYGTTDIAIYRCAQGDTPSEASPVLGLASKYPNDKGIDQDPDVIFFCRLPIQ